MTDLRIYLSFKSYCSVASMESRYIGRHIKDQVYRSNYPTINNFSTSGICNLYENLSLSVSSMELLCWFYSELGEFCCTTAGKAECAHVVLSPEWQVREYLSSLRSGCGNSKQAIHLFVYPFKITDEDR